MSDFEIEAQASYFAELAMAQRTKEINKISIERIQRTCFRRKDIVAAIKKYDQNYNSLETRQQTAYIHGDITGEMASTTAFFSSLEYAYNSLFVLYSICAMPHLPANYILEKYQREHLNDLIPSSNRLAMVHLNFNSLGKMGVRASTVSSNSPLETIRRYIKDRHERKRDIEYAWEQEKKEKSLDIAKKEGEIIERQLENDRKAFDNCIHRITETANLHKQLRDAGYSDADVELLLEKFVYSMLPNLDSHIDAGQLTDIVIDEE